MFALSYTLPKSLDALSNYIFGFSGQFCIDDVTNWQQRDSFFYSGFSLSQVRSIMRRADDAENAQLKRHTLCSLWRKMQPHQVRSRSYDVMSGITFDRFFNEIVISEQLGLLPLTGMGPYEWFRSENDHIWPLRSHFDLSKVIRGHWPWLTPYLPVVAKLVVFVVSWVPETEFVSFFYSFFQTCL